MVSKENPLLAKSGIPRFDQIETSHIEPAVKQVLMESEKKLIELEDNIIPTWDGLLKPLQEISAPFEYAWGPVGHLLNVKNSKELREEHQKMQPKVVQFSLRSSQSRPIYEGLLEILLRANRVPFQWCCSR